MSEHERHTVVNKRLGKHPYKHDECSIRLGAHLRQLRPTVPSFDTTAFLGGGFPIHYWGNDNWGDCVLAARANQFLFNEKTQFKQWLPLKDQMVIDTYKLLTGSQTPGDARDSGLVVLDALKDWRAGWKLQLNSKSPSGGYKIDLFGELNYKVTTELKASIQFLHGVTMGFQLPRAAMNMNAVWDTTGQKGAIWEPGSWGGHCVLAYGFSPKGIKILSWGQEVLVTRRFILRYCDEAWGIVPALDNPDAAKVVNVPALEANLRNIGAVVES